MKVIFLDFDGVITTKKSGFYLDKEKMEIVKGICDKTGAKIVITSSWRRHTLEDTIEYITTKQKEKGNIPFLMPELVVGITKRMYAFSHEDESKYYRLPRGMEVDNYLDEHSEVEDYVILDDDSDFFIEQLPYFVKTNTYNGISEEDAEKVISILK